MTLRSVGLLMFVAACTPMLGAKAPEAEAPYAARAAAWALRDECPECAEFPVYAEENLDAGACLRWFITGPAVVYDPSWLRLLTYSYGDEAEVWAYAHEYGHWIHGYALGWRAELASDRLAGCALARLGLNPQGALDSMIMVSPSPTHTHPGYEQRREAISAGFTACRNAGSSPR